MSATRFTGGGEMAEPAESAVMRSTDEHARATPGRVAPVRPPGTRAVWAALAVGPALIVILFAGTTYRGLRAARASREAVRHSRDVIDNAAVALSALQDAETGQRGFILTGSEQYLTPYLDARSRLRADTTALRRAVQNDTLQSRRLDLVEGLIQRKMAEPEQTVSLRRAGAESAALAMVETGGGKATMDSIRAVLGALTAEERQRLERRNVVEAARGRSLMLLLVLGSAAAALLSLVLGASLYRAAWFEATAVRTLEAQQRELRAQTAELERQAQMLQDQASELEAQNVDLQEQAEELEQSTQELGDQTRAAEQARDAAEAANRAKSDFLAMMSHELRTPLNAIAGYAQLMQLGIPEPVPAAHWDYLHRIQASQHHLLAIINSVLNFARLEAGAVAYVLCDVAVSDLLEAVEPLIAPQARAKSLTYACASCDPSLLVRVDPEKVTQILLNLISNAVKFTPPNGRIVLSAAADDRAGQETVAIRVTDTGIGIPPDKLKTIFDPFVQVDQSRTRTTDGAGLGLAISRELARGMGGDLDCESVLGAGSVFTLHLERLPYAARDGAASHAGTSSRDRER